MKKTLLLVLILQAVTSLSMAAEKCDIKQFKNLYIRLQQELNYEGKDAVYNTKNNSLTLKAHDLKGHNLEESYGGKVYEKILHKQYTNALRKVALLYRHTKAGPTETSAYDNEVVKFFQSIDDEKQKYPMEDFKKFETLVNSLKDSSQKTNLDEKSKINAQDAYLLKKLLIHAYDTICRTQAYNTGKKLSANDRAKAKNSIDSALTMMTQSFKDNIKAINESDKKKNQSASEIIEASLTAREETVNSAIKDNLKDLKKWLNAQTPSCQKEILNLRNFNNIQPCNYKKFIESIMVVDENEFKDYESILHFINANQKHGSITPVAETGLSKDFAAQLYLKYCGDPGTYKLSKTNECICLPNAVKDDSGMCVLKKDAPEPKPESDLQQCKTAEDKGYKLGVWFLRKGGNIQINRQSQTNFSILGANGNRSNSRASNNGFSFNQQNGQLRFKGGTFLNGDQNSNSSLSLGGDSSNNLGDGSGNLLKITDDGTRNGLQNDSNSDATQNTNSCTCSLEDKAGCCEQGYKYDNNACVVDDGKSGFDFLKQCNPNTDDKDRSEEENKCIKKEEPKTNPFDFAKDCNPETDDQAKSEAEKQCIKKEAEPEVKEFDFNKDCKPETDDQVKSEAAKKCTPKENPSSETAKKSCDQLDKNIYKLEAWKVNDKGQCICDANSDACCQTEDQSVDAEGTRTKNISYKYEGGKCVPKAMEIPASNKTPTSEPMFSTQKKNRPGAFRPIIVQPEQIMIMPGQR